MNRKPAMRRELTALLGTLFLMGAAHRPYCGPDAFRSQASWASAASHGSLSNCGMYRFHAPKQTFLLAVAKSQKERERGLMLVRSLPAHAGMLFIFPDGDAPRVFWMKNTLVSLDMVFVGADGTVNGVARDVPAVTTATRDEDIPRRFGVGKFVIELNAGEASAAGIVPGVRLNLNARTS